MATAATLAVMVAFLALGAVGGRAQNATPGATSTGGQPMMAHPAHIHKGTCASLGDVVFPLADVGGNEMSMMATPGAGGAMASPAAGGMMGASSAVHVEMSVTKVQASLQTIISGGHAINVHESAQNIQKYIACGDIGGMVMGADLEIGLRELNGSGYSGIAWLHDNGDGSTTVTIFLAQGLSGAGMMATPAA